MKISQLFSIYSQFKMGENSMAEVTSLVTDSRQVQAGAVYVAIRGTKQDGHDFLGVVCSKKISGVVVEDPQSVPPEFAGAVLVVKNTREALVKLAARYFGEPAEKLFCIGVTGTNGKTSTTYLIEAILNQFGLKTGVMGTIDHHLGEHVWASALTTPDAITLQRRLNEFLTLGAKAAAFEVSSHALEQDRAAGIPFDAIIFTNLTRDHLDYHHTIEGYFAAKEKLFLELPAQYPSKPVRAIINASDEWGKKIRVASNVEVWTYGECQADFQLQVLDMGYDKTRFRLRTPRGETEISLPLPGRHNVYNAVAAMAVGLQAGASLETCQKALESFKGVPGRLQRVETPSPLHVFVDYAHTDDALKTVLQLLCQVREQSHGKNKIITIFGCGGDRDRGKRPLMAQVAVEMSDLVFITSDNPRTEDPMGIVLDVLKGVPKELINKQVFVEVERRQAIRKAIDAATRGDVILIAGKGHENYQIIGQKKLDFSDVQVAAEILHGG